jgi:hypothetical protein
VVELEGGKRKRMPAECYGIWAAHYYYADADRTNWRVTHIQSGRAACVGVDPSTARLLALLLAERVPVFDYDGTTPPRYDWDWYYIVEATVGEVVGA